MSAVVRSAVHALVLGLGATTLAQAQGALPPRFVPKSQAVVMTDRLIVKYRTGESAYPSAAAEMAVRIASNRQGVATEPLRRMANGAHVFRFNRHLSTDEAHAMAQAVRAGDPNVEYAEPDLILQATQTAWTPADPMYSQQWALTDSVGGIRAPGAWSTTRGSGVVVAVIDTGVRPHADLVGNLVAGVDFITDPAVAADGGGRDSDPADPGDYAAAGACGTGSQATRSSWHGTHVTGIIAATSNGVGVTGVAPSAKVQPLRALGRCGGYSSDIADAMTWAAGGTISGIAANPTPAKVINLSLGGTGSCSITMQNAINAARARGATVVVAAGNSATSSTTATPANCSGVITVAATGRAGAKASYSNFGSNVTLAAPGGDSTGGGILSTLNSGTSTPGVDTYASYMGTSMAAPVVSGVVALMLSAKPTLTPDQVATILKATATPFPAACSGCGSGIVNAQAAVAAALSATAPAPSPAPAPAPSPAPAPAPAPSPAVVAEVEPNNTIAAAQVLGSSTTQVTGSLTSGDNDYFRVTLAAGKRLSATVVPGSATAAGLGVYLTSGQQLLLLTGVKGTSRTAVITNAGTAPVNVVLRVTLSSGSAGAYVLNMSQ